MKNIQVGIIGSGFMAKTHAISLQRYLSNCNLNGIAGGMRAAGLAKELNIPLYDSVESLVKSTSIDAIIITSPHNLHYEHARQVLANKKHILLEKPMASSSAQCRELIDLADRNSLKLMVAFTQRYRQSNRLTWEIISSGKIGKINMIQEWGIVSGGIDNYPDWQNRAENLGTLYGYGIHNIDKLRWLLNSEVQQISAQYIKGPNNIETSTMALLKFTNGSMASLWTGVDVIRPGFPGSTYRSFISGDLGLLDVDGYGAVQACYDKQNWETLYVQPAVDWQGEGKFAINRMASFNAQNQDFIDCIVNNTRPPVSGVDGEISVHIVEQIYQAARENRTIRFQEN